MNVTKMKKKQLTNQQQTINKRLTNNQQQTRMKRKKRMKKKLFWIVGLNTGSQQKRL